MSVWLTTRSDFAPAATWLLELQAEDGHFPGWGYEDVTAATCFGLLFLKKAALPVHTK